MIGNLVCLVTPGPAINSFAPHLAVSTRLVFDTIFEKRNKRKKKGIRILRGAANAPTLVENYYKDV